MSGKHEQRLHRSFFDVFHAQVNQTGSNIEAGSRLWALGFGQEQKSMKISRL
jgi:hypothetical protein